MNWHILTGEYPPQLGGVADYTWQVARGLAAEGDEVQVWAPRSRGAGLNELGVTLHRLPDHFGPRGLALLSRSIGRQSGARILVQYVPHAFGWKAMNLPLCLWLAGQRGNDLTVMFHEVAVAVGTDQRLRDNLLGIVNRLMAWTVARSAGQIFFAVPGWEPLLRPAIGKRTPVRWLPVPSNVPRIDDPAAAHEIRRQHLGQSKFLIGHFGTYGAWIADAVHVLAIDLLRRRGDVTLLLMGTNSRVFRDRLVEADGSLAPRVRATGRLAAEELSLHVSACDLMVQPYPDGISGRRTSAMLVLSHGVPIVSTLGHLSEPLWKECGAVALGSAGDADRLTDQVERLLDDSGERRRLKSAGRDLYDRHFDLRHTIAALRGADSRAARAA